MVQTIPHPVVQTVDRNSIQPGNLYAFRLTAVDSAGNQSVPSDIVSVGIPHVVWTLNQIPSGSPTTVPLSSFISDPDNNTSEMIINISNQNNVTATVNGTNLILTPNPLAYVGSAGFTIRIEDPDGFWDSANVQFNIVQANQPPVVSDIPNQTIPEGQNFATINLDNYVADPDNPDDQITWTYGGNTSLTVSISPTRVATITVPNSNWNGSETITFTATDPGGLSDSDPATFTVTPVNDPPVVSDIPNQTVPEGQNFATISLDNYVADPDNPDNQITWTFSGNTALTVSISPTRVATISVPNSNWNGSETITFTATDPGGLFDSDPATFTVTPVNDPPAVADIPDQTITEGNNFSVIQLDNFVSDPDNPDDQITWTYSGNTELTVSISPTRVATISIPNSNWNGSETITFTATDPGGLSDSDPATFTVTPVNDPPVVVDIPDQTITEGNNFSVIQLDNFVSDPDNPDNQITWTYSGNNELNVNIDANRVATIAIPNTNWNGSETITFTATDPGGLSDSDPATFTVTGVNDPPHITSNPVTGATQGQLYQYQVTANDPDPGDVLTYSLITSPGFININATSGLISGTPAVADTGAHIVEARVTDVAGAFDTQNYTLTVLYSNAPPVVSDIPNQTISEGQNFATISLDNYVADPNNPDDEITWTYSGNSELTVSISPARVATITPPNPDWNGSETITFTATDPGGLSDSDPATFTVTPVNDPPQITSNPVLNVAAGDIYEYQVTAIDPDPSEVLTYSLTTAPAFLSVNSTSGLISGTPAMTDTGSHNVAVRVEDLQGAFDTQNYVLTVTFVNLAPVVADIPDQTIIEGSNFSVIQLDNFVSDPNNTVNQIAWTYSGNNELNVNIDVNRVATIIIPDSNWNGSETITFTATDPGGLSDSDPSTSTVTGVNDPPHITSFPVTAATQGQLHHHQVTANDPDPGDVLTYSLVTSPGFLNINDTTGLISGTPAVTDTGAHPVEVRVTDLAGAFDTQNYTLTVLYSNAPPIVADIPDQIISEGLNFATISLDDYVTDPENPDDEITWTFSGNLVLTVSISPTRMATITPPNPDWNGNETITFTATDPGGLSDSDPATFTVTPVNDPPVLNLSQLILQGVSSQTFDLKPFAIDVESSVYDLSWQFNSYSHFQFTWEDGLNKIIRIENIDATLSENGYFIVSDPEGASDTSLVTLFYIADTSDTGPSLALLPEQMNFKEDFSLSIKLDTVCFDVTNAFNELTFQFYPGDNLHHSYNAATSLLEIYADPDWFGDSDFRIDVTDPDGHLTSKTMSLQVEPVCDLSHIKINPMAQNQVAVEIDTDEPSSIEMSFWVTPFLKSTYKSSEFAVKHNFSLSDLIPDTTYSYSLTLFDTSGIEMLYSDSTFNTTYQISPTENLAEVYVFPNPYRPSRGHSVVVFDNIPADAKDLVVFSLTGDLVYERTFSGLPQRRMPWNVINNNGDRLASGFYIYVLKGENGKKIKSGKIAVIR